MCGIHGFTWQDADDAIGRMVSAAAHRGPDGSGTWGDERVTLGHNLLAVADIVGASTQPWVTDRHVLAFNGEVYNYRELRSKLAHKCRTDSDTEVLAAGLAEKGPKFLESVDGMFALAWYDRRTGELHLARDSNGARPLYYGFRKDRLAFSSEVRSLLALGFDRRVSREGFRHFYYSGLVAGWLTLFDGVYKILPGEVVKFTVADGLKRLFNLNDRPPLPYRGAPSDLPALLSAELNRSCARAVTGRRKTGLLLSGGMDSTSILFELAGRGGPLPDTFTTRFEGVDNPDADVARNLAKLYGTTHEEVLVGERRWIDNLEAVVAALEEPRQGKSHPAYYATYKLMASRGVVVTLSGDGGDELLMGYKHHLDPPFSHKLAGLRQGHRPLKNPGLQMTLEEQVQYLSGWLPKGGLTGDLVNDFMYTECLHTLAEDYLIRGDKLGAAFGMEARFPMLCRPFRDLCRSIPSKYKRGPKTEDWDQGNKHLLRMAYHRRMPGYVTKKRKSGWRAPTNEWIVGKKSRPAPDDGPVRAYFRELLADPVLRELFEITDHDVENRYLNNRDFEGKAKPSGKAGIGPGLAVQKELFTVVAFAVWFRLFGMRLW